MALSNKEKIDYIIRLLDKLYCFKPYELAKFKSKIPFMKEPGLSKLLAVLQEGKIQQDELIANFVKRDAGFASDFLGFVKKTSKKLKNMYEIQEKKEADNILNEL